jgi:hypothetical protein
MPQVGPSGRDRTRGSKSTWTAATGAFTPAKSASSISWPSRRGGERFAREWSKYFEVLEYLEGEINADEDLVVARRTA